MKDSRQGSDPQCVLCCISATKERTLCTKLKNMRQLKRLLRYVKGPEDMSTVFEVGDNSDRREQLVKR